MASHGSIYRSPIHSRCARSTLAISRIMGRVPPFHALRLDAALPFAVFGPVDRCHGFQRRTASDCALQCAAVQ